MNKWLNHLMFLVIFVFVLMLFPLVGCEGSTAWEEICCAKVVSVERNPGSGGFSRVNPSTTVLLDNGYSIVLYGSPAIKVGEEGCLKKKGRHSRYEMKFFVSTGDYYVK